MANKHGNYITTVLPDIRSLLPGSEFGKAAARLAGGPFEGTARHLPAPSRRISGQQLLVEAPGLTWDTYGYLGETKHQEVVPLVARRISWRWWLSAMCTYAIRASEVANQLTMWYNRDEIDRAFPFGLLAASMFEVCILEPGYCWHCCGAGHVPLFFLAFLGFKIGCPTKKTDQQSDHI